MAEPLFKIGDLVTTKAHLAAKAAAGKYHLDSGSLVGQVVEVIEQTCYAGMQRSYGVRWGSADSVTHQAVSVSEPELVLHSPADYPTGYAGAIKHLAKAKECLVDAQDFELAAESRDLCDRLKKLSKAAEAAASKTV